MWRWAACRGGPWAGFRSVGGVQVEVCGVLGGGV